MNDPNHRLNDVDVKTENRVYQNANVELFDFWTVVHTSREEPDSDPHVVVPNVRIKEIVQ